MFSRYNLSVHPLSLLACSYYICKLELDLKYNWGPWERRHFCKHNEHVPSVRGRILSVYVAPCCFRECQSSRRPFKCGRGHIYVHTTKAMWPHVCESAQDTLACIHICRAVCMRSGYPGRMEMQWPRILSCCLWIQLGVSAQHFLRICEIAVKTNNSHLQSLSQYNSILEHQGH